MYARISFMYCGIFGCSGSAVNAVLLFLAVIKYCFFSVVVLQLNKSRNKSVPALDLQFALDQGQNFWWVSKG